MTDEQIITEILEREGGGTYTDREDDAGGPTRWGITQATLAAWRCHPVEPGEVAALTEVEARAIYRQRYIVEPGFSKVPDEELRALLVDCGVQYGAAGRPRPGDDSAVGMLQRALDVGLEVDGVLGPATLGAVLRADPRKLWDRLLGERLSFIGWRISHDMTDRDHDGKPDAAEQAHGHLNRCSQLLKERT